ncbi:MAG: cell division ATP-binding protein FtsE [Syntrophobacteraceae bacterium]
MRKSYGRGPDIFCGANLQILEGEFMLLTGANGSGKSTLIRLLLRLESLDEGHISINGKNLQDFRQSEIPYFRCRVGVVFQDIKLMMRRTVFENVALPLHVLGRDRFFIQKKVQQTLDAFGLNHAKAQQCSLLSESERRLAMIARALIHDPVILLLDEPAANLDHNSFSILMDSVRKANDHGSTIVYATREESISSLFPNFRAVAIEGGKILDKSASSDRTGLAG